MMTTKKVLGGFATLGLLLGGVFVTNYLRSESNSVDSPTPTTFNENAEHLILDVNVQDENSDVQFFDENDFTPTDEMKYTIDLAD